MKRSLALVACLCGFSGASLAGDPAIFERDNIALRPAHTFSIVAFDPATGQLGAAVQSHWFSVGSIVIWAEPASARSPPSRSSKSVTARTGWR